MTEFPRQAVEKILAAVLSETVYRSFLALEDEGAIDLTALRLDLSSRDGEFRRIVAERSEYTAHWAPTDLNKIEPHLMGMMGDAFNRSINALEGIGALDRERLQPQYRGVGSRYYDLVTNVMESCKHIWQDQLQHYRAQGHVYDFNKSLP